MAGSTGPDSQAANPEGWLDATSRSPANETRSVSVSAPLASTWVRPGKVAAKLSTVHPVPAGRTSMRMSRTVVSLATTAGRLKLARPGTCGMGICAAMSITAWMRRWAEAAASRPVLARSPSPSRLTSICWPSAVSRNSGASPVSSVASPVTT